MKKPLRTLLGIVIVLLLIALIAWPKLVQDEVQGPESAVLSEAASALPVEVTVVQPSVYQNAIQVTGSVQANEMLELRSEVAGILEQVNFKEGQPVKKGDLLFTIRNQDLLAQLRRVQAQQELYQSSESRYRQLLEREAVSREEYEQATSNLKTTEADLALLRAQLAKTRVYAPFGGTLGLRKVSPGSYVSAGTAIASLYDLSPAKIEFSVPGKYSGQIKAGAQITFTTDASDKVYPAEVYAVEPQVDPATRTLSMRALSPNPAGELLPGQFARISLNLGQEDESLMVASEAVVPEMDGHKVYVLENGQVAEKKIDIGARTAQQVQVLAGLKPGDTVLTTGILQVRPGDAVRVTKVN